MAAIFLVSSQPATDLPNFGLLDLLLKKMGHFVAYALLALLVQRAYQPQTVSWQRALLITVMYAISDELHQRSVPGRFGSLADVLIDSSGALTALLISHYRYTVRGHRYGSYGSQLRAQRLPVEAQSAQTVPLDEPTSPGA